MVRHGESPKEGTERTRSLTEKGYLDTQRVTDLLKDEDIDTVNSYFVTVVKGVFLSRQSIILLERAKIVGKKLWYKAKIRKTL